MSYKLRISLIILFLGSLFYVEQFAHWLGIHDKSAMSLTNLILAIGAAVAAVVAIQAYKAQLEQSRITLWRSLCEEWDYKMRTARGAAVGEYSNHKDKKLHSTAQRMMDYFETLAYLVRNNYIPNELANHTWSYYFAGYFKAAHEFVNEQRLDDESFYKDIVWLAKFWGKDESIEKPDGLYIFFNEEMNNISSG
jgi:hypothetical protein